MQNLPTFTPSLTGVPSFIIELWPLFVVVIIWTVAIKGYALWTSARSGQKWWFIALLVINTIGMLEIVYLIWFRPKSGINEVTPAQSSSPQA